jgi:CheY-like chemotaxis protein
MSQRLRALVVDDEEILRRLLRITINGMGYEVDLASHANEAISLLQTNEYDLLLTDLQMPGDPIQGPFSGQRIVEEARQLDPELPIIVASSHVSNQMVPWLRLFHVEGLTKPFSYEDIQMAEKNAKSRIPQP